MVTCPICGEPLEGAVVVCGACGEELPLQVVVVSEGSRGGGFALAQGARDQKQEAESEHDQS